ncbi:MAG: hypothetical protein QGH47_03740, partial [Candidatus Woesearchaeota archaeon]|nr:hypothetical protein [Candidatus Woesearchaeota archaeon]
MKNKLVLAVLLGILLVSLGITVSGYTSGTGDINCQNPLFAFLCPSPKVCLTDGSCVLQVECGDGAISGSEECDKAKGHFLLGKAIRVPIAPAVTPYSHTSGSSSGEIMTLDMTSATLVDSVTQFTVFLYMQGGVVNVEPIIDGVG